MREVLKVKDISKSVWKAGLVGSVPAALGMAKNMIVLPFMEGTLDKGDLYLFVGSWLAVVVGVVLLGHVLIWWLFRRERRRDALVFDKVVPFDGRTLNVGVIVIDSEGRQLQ